MIIPVANSSTPKPTGTVITEGTDVAQQSGALVGDIFAALLSGLLVQDAASTPTKTPQIVPNDVQSGAHVDQLKQEVAPSSPTPQQAAVGQGEKTDKEVAIPDPTLSQLPAAWLAWLTQHVNELPVLQGTPSSTPNLESAKLDPKRLELLLASKNDPIPLVLEQRVNPVHHQTALANSLLALGVQDLSLQGKKTEHMVVSKDSEPATVTTGQAPLLTTIDIHSLRSSHLSPLSEQVATKPPEVTVNVRDFSKQFPDLLIKHGRLTLQDGGIREFQVKLIPQGMGEIHIRVHADGAHMVVQLMTDSTSARQLIDSQIPMLRGQFDQQGIPVQRIDVTSITSNQAGFLGGGMLGQDSSGGGSRQVFQSRKKDVVQGIDQDVQAAFDRWLDPVQNIDYSV